MNGFDALILEQLFAVIETRRDSGDPNSSYTAKLLEKGRKKISKKVGEEAVEVVVAALAESKDRLAAESADLLYHLLVLWADAGLKPKDVWAALAAREGMSGLAEKAARANKK